jgi:small subunit ribosomal protein S8
MINDHISNMLVRIRNAQNARFDHVELPANRMLESIAQILRQEGYIKAFKVFQDKRKQAVLRIALKNLPEHGYAIKGMKRVSRPSRRVYVGKEDIPTVKSGYGIAIISTSRGVMTGEKARKLSVGGEILCEVW